jgi:gliding motility-associated-like protein
VQVTIGNANPDIAATFGITPATCDGNDGAITNITSSGGSSSTYQYSINGGQDFQSGNSFTSLTGGVYTLKVRDSNGCEKDFTANVTFPGFINSIISRTNANCNNNGLSGSITVNITDPGLFQVALSTDQFNEPADADYKNYTNPSVTFNQLARGQYFVYMKSNAASCPTRSAAIDINGTQALTFDIQAQCVGTDLSISLINITGEPNLPFEISVFRKFTNVLVETIPVSSIPVTGSVYLDNEDHAFLRTAEEYQIQLVQVDPFIACELRSPLEDLKVPSPLNAAVINITQSYPDMATGNLQVGNFNGGGTPYDVRIELDSASSSALPFFETDFEEVLLNNNQQYGKIYDGIPPGRYIVEVKDSLGCSIESLARVPMDQSIYVPNIFTPNDDGANDVFFIRNLPTEDGKAKLIVSSRWGKEVFNTDNYKNDWAGEGAADGIYFYQLQVGSGKPLTGWVEILRGQKP